MLVQSTGKGASLFLDVMARDLLNLARLLNACLPTGVLGGPHHWKPAFSPVVVQVIPDIRDRTELELIGSPLTHRSFLRRHRGTYGPAISARHGSFPGPATSVPGLYGCGDSYMPGIGVPAVAASGMIAANTLVSLPKHLSMLRDLKL